GQSARLDFSRGAQPGAERADVGAVATRPGGVGRDVGGSAGRSRTKSGAILRIAAAAHASFGCGAGSAGARSVLPALAGGRFALSRNRPSAGNVAGSGVD